MGTFLVHVAFFPNPSKVQGSRVIMYIVGAQTVICHLKNGKIMFRPRSRFRHNLLRSLPSPYDGRWNHYLWQRKIRRFSPPLTTSAVKNPATIQCFSFTFFGSVYHFSPYFLSPLFPLSSHFSLPILHVFCYMFLHILILLSKLLQVLYIYTWYT